MSFRTWTTIISLLLIGVVVVFGWEDIKSAWGLLGQVNLWILSLMIPLQIFSYYTTGSMIFSYLRSKGELKKTSRWRMVRISLELNFVNHIIPSGGAVGFSYLGWLLSHEGVRPGRATMAQIIRFLLTFLTFVLLLGVAVIVLAIDQQINRVIIMLCAGIAVVAIAGTILTIYLLQNKYRLNRFARRLTRMVNRVVAFFTRGKKTEVLHGDVIGKFFDEIHEDYVDIRRDKKVLIKPLLWGIVNNLADVALLAVAFWALGAAINPAVFLIAFGLSSIASIFSVTPGGAGVYEAIMIAFMASAGVPADLAIAGTILARVVLVLGTIVFGYFFYQLTISKYGGPKPLQR